MNRLRYSLMVLWRRSLILRTSCTLFVWSIRNCILDISSLDLTIVNLKCRVRQLCRRRVSFLRRLY